MSENISGSETTKTPSTASDTSETNKETHGPLRKLSYNLSSHGMMAGTGSNTNYSIEWKDDGTVIYTSSSMFDGKNFITENKVKPEVARKIRDFVEEKELVKLTKMDIPRVDMADNFTSASISMTFDDSSLGKSPYEMFFLNCGPSGWTFKPIEDEIYALFNECRENSECINSKMFDGSGIGGVAGFMGIGEMMNMSAPSVNPNKENSPERDDVSSPKWVCSCGYSDNSGKFCCNCGNPRPAAEDPEMWTCPDCKTECNKGNFCAACGKPRPK